MIRTGRNQVVLLDRDGTVIAERHYLSNPDDVELLPGAAMALRRLRALGCGLVVVSNQSAVARGYLTIERLNEIHARLRALLAAEGVELDGIYACPHHPDDRCECRKPNPGLALIAAADLGFDLRDAIVIGDNVCDVELGRRLDALTCLVLTGHGEAARAALGQPPDIVASDLAAAVDAIEPALRVATEASLEAGREESLGTKPRCAYR